MLSNDLTVCSVLCGNRNFEGRIHAQVKANYLASPPLVVAYALAGTINIDLTTEPLGYDKDNNPVYLKDIWPSNEEIKQAINECDEPGNVQGEIQRRIHANERWNDIPSAGRQAV